MPHLIGIERINRAFKEGASKLAHSKGFASGKKYAALGGTPVLPANQKIKRFPSFETAAGEPSHMFCGAGSKKYATLG